MAEITTEYIQTAVNYSIAMEILEARASLAIIPQKGERSILNNE